MNSVIRFDMPFVVFLGDIRDEVFAKTGLGLVQWRREHCLGQVRLEGCAVDAGVPDLTVEQAAAAGARSFVVGAATPGGSVPDSWIAALSDAAERGLDVIAGLHLRLGSLPGLNHAASRGGSRLVDVRVPPERLPVSSGRRRTGRRLLTVGTDCACGKKYTALALADELRRRGVPSTFRATGQTGIMIAGEGIPLDAVVADFLAGAAELLSPDNRPSHWDIVEGQGSLFHPAYLQVSAGLLIGTQPDAFVVCHDATRTRVAGWPDFPLPSLRQVIDRTIDLGQLTNVGVRCVGVSINTSRIPTGRRRDVLGAFQQQVGLPCVDPLVEGVGNIVERLLQDYPP